MIIAREQVLSELTSRLKGRMHTRPILLLGAGASFSSGVPLARECVVQIVRRRLDDALHVPQAQAIASDGERLEEWIRAQPWSGTFHDLAELFPIVVDKYLNPTALRTDFLIDVITMDRLSDGYRHLGKMVNRDIFKTILTTNFDECLPSMFHEAAPRARLTEVGRWPGDAREFRLNNRQIVWMHGRLEQYSARNTLDEIDDLDPLIVSSAAAAVREAPLVVVGYRGSENSIMKKFFAAHASEPLFFKHGIYWCSPDRNLHPNVVALEEAVGTKDFFRMPIDSFDDLMEDLDWSLMEVDHSQQNSFKGWQPWVDCLSSESLQVLAWSQTSHCWRRTPLSRLDAGASDDGFSLRNNITRNDIEHIQVGARTLLDSDFLAEIEISGDFYEIKLQCSDLSDRNIYVTPSRFGVSNQERNRFRITRVADRIAFGVWKNSRWSTLEASHYDVDGKLTLADLARHKFLLCLNVFKAARVIVHEFRLRTS